VDPKWIRGPVDELAIRQGCYFDQEAADYVCEFLETFCFLSQGRQFAGRPLVLIPWQRDLISRAYGWKRPDGTRRYRKVYLEVPKKNGKSALFSGVANYHVIADGEDGAEVHLNACTRQQAGILFREAARMVEASPDLAGRLEVIESAGRIVHKASSSFIRANSADVDSKDGINSSCTIFDELHRQKTTAMWDVFEYAGVAREQPILFSITTAGEDLNSVCYREHEYAVRVNEGKVDDIGFLGVIYAAEATDDIDDPATWRKANPSMGYTIDEERFGEELAAAKASPTKFAMFKRLRLNIWTQTEARFLTREAWEACGKFAIHIAKLLKQRAYGGLDLSSTTDLSAFVLAFGDLVDGVDLIAKFWLPQEHIDDLSRRDRVPYRLWAEEGWITLTEGPVIDYEFIRAQINDFATDYELVKLLADPHNAVNLGTNLIADGINLEFIKQGFISLSPPTKELERLVLSKKLRHGNNPILTWHADVAKTSMDPAGNIKLSKSRSREKIDGMAALVNAIGALNTSDPADSEPSVYEKRGMIFL
jgi:phage terminase large subunit-like protein